MLDLSRLLDLLDIETIDVDLYRGHCSVSQRDRVYGGQVAAQALVAAGRTVEADRHVHSLHAYFMRPGDPTIPIVYAVSRVQPVSYGEIVATVSSKSVGPGTRKNIDEFTRTTAGAVEKVGGAKKGKAIIVINPAGSMELSRTSIRPAKDEPFTAPRPT